LRINRKWTEIKLSIWWFKFIFWLSCIL